MKKTLILLTLCLMAIITGCSGQQLKTSDQGVVINGVCWATRNVAAPGTFADKPEDAGMFYQWNRKKAWKTTDSIVSGWDTSMPEGNEWEKANDPSPKGWRVPTAREMSSLFDENKVILEWISSKNVTGIKVTDITYRNTIFLPAVGSRDYYNGTLSYTGSCGLYWNSSQNINNIEFYRKGFGDSDNMVLYYLGSKNAIYGFSLRCVAE